MEEHCDPSYEVPLFRLFSLAHNQTLKREKNIQHIGIPKHIKLCDEIVPPYLRCSWHYISFIL